MPALSAETLEAVDNIITDQCLPLFAKINKQFKCIADNGMGYCQNIVSKDTLTDPSNRGESLLNMNWKFDIATNDLLWSQNTNLQLYH